MAPPLPHDAGHVVLDEDVIGPVAIAVASAGSGIAFTSPPQTNSEMLRGPFRGQFRIFMAGS